MAFDLTAGSALFTFTSPTGDVTDPSLIANIQRSSFATEQNATDFFALFTSTDMTKCRVAKGDGLTELAFDIFEYDLTVGSEYVIMRFLYSGTLTSSGTYQFYFMPALDGNTSYGVSDTYGQYNAYGDDYVGYWPLCVDFSNRTSSSYTGSGNGGISSGGSVGQIGQATDFDSGSSQSIDIFSSAEDPLNALAEFSVSAWCEPDSVSSTDKAIVARWGGSNTDQQFLLDIDIGGSGASPRIIAGDKTTIIADPDDNSVSVDTWHMLSGRFNAAELAVYLDGAVKQTTTGTFGDIVAANTYPTQIGNRGNGSYYFDGAIQHVAIHKTDVGSVLFDYEYTQTADNSTWLGTATYNAPSGSGYTIDAEAGSIALTGQDVTFNILASYSITAEAGALLLTGEDVSLLKNSIISASAGAIEIAGGDAELTTVNVYSINAESGSVEITGGDTTLNVLTGYTLSAESGSIELTGSDISALVDRVISTESIGVNISGSSVSLDYSGSVDKFCMLIGVVDFDSTVDSELILLISDSVKFQESVDEEKIISLSETVAFDTEEC